jgi:hypothetical protein
MVWRVVIVWSALTGCTSGSPRESGMSDKGIATIREVILGLALESHCGGRRIGFHLGKQSIVISCWRLNVFESPSDCKIAAEEGHIAHLSDL